MIYVLMIFIGITVGLIISKLIDTTKERKIDEEFLELAEKIALEEEKSKKKELKSDMKRY